jgi:hypothetical protein
MIRPVGRPSRKPMAEVAIGIFLANYWEYMFNILIIRWL